MSAVPDTPAPSPASQPVSALLRMVQTSVLNRWRATGEDLYREVARLAGIESGQDVLVAGCGRGVTTEWLATRTGAALTGVDPDGQDIEKAEERARTISSPLQLTYQQSVLDDLPYESEVFDAAIGEPEVSTASHPEAAVKELARVTKSMCPVVLLQVTWRSDIPLAARERLSQRFGLQPKLVVEWKQALRAAGLVDIQVDDWTNECDCKLSGDALENCIPANWQETLPGYGPFRRSGWKEARQLLTRETEFWGELLRERTLCFSIIKGVKWPSATAGA